MIKINLNRSRVPNAGGASVDEGTAVDISDGGSPSSTGGRDMLVKLLVMTLGVAALALYQKQNLDQLDAQLATVNAQVAKLQADVEAKQTELAQLKDIEPQAQSLGDKLRILREFSKLRLFQLQSLDFMQSVIPEKVWLESVQYDAQKYKILGFAVETTDLSEFVQRLEGSAYFQDVIVIQDREKVAQGGKIRDFEMSSRSEVKN